MHSFQLTALCKIDATAAHQPASIVSAAKFGSTGQLASLQCQLSVLEAAWSIFVHVERSIPSAVDWFENLA